MCSSLLYSLMIYIIRNPKKKAIFYINVGLFILFIQCIMIILLTDTLLFLVVPTYKNLQNSFLLLNIKLMDSSTLFISVYAMYTL
jgi:hypothetical protein